MEAFLHATGDELDLPDTGSACDDFRAQIGELGSLLRGPRGQALAAMLGGARTDPNSPVRWANAGWAHGNAEVVSA